MNIWDTTLGSRYNKLWSVISELGLRHDTDGRVRKKILLSNRLSVITFLYLQ